MVDGPTRQRYGLATGKGLVPTASKKGSPGYARGGHVSKGKSGCGGVTKMPSMPGFKHTKRGV